MKLLIVDDMHIVRRYMHRLLCTYGECDTAESGEIAVKMVRESLKKTQPYDVICLDVMMPRWDGLRTLQMIRELENKESYKEIPASIILMVTSVKGSNYVAACLESGCNGYLIKPVDKIILENEMKKFDLIN